MAWSHSGLVPSRVRTVSAATTSGDGRALLGARSGRGLRRIGVGAGYDWKCECTPASASSSTLPTSTSATPWNAWERNVLPGSDADLRWRPHPSLVAVASATDRIATRPRFQSALSARIQAQPGWYASSLLDQAGPRSTMREFSTTRQVHSGEEAARGAASSVGKATQPVAGATQTPGNDPVPQVEGEIVQALPPPGPPYDVLFLGSDELAVAVLEGIYARKDLYRSIHIRTLPGPNVSWATEQMKVSPVEVFAMKHSLPCSQIEGSVATLAALELPPELQTQKPSSLLVTAGFDSLLPDETVRWFADQSPSLALNVHPSLLPKLRGGSPLQWAIAHRHTHTGATVQQMSLGSYCSGSVLAQRTMPLSSTATTESARPTMAYLCASLLVDTLTDLPLKHGQAQPQDDGQATLAPKLRLEHSVIDWAKHTAEDIEARQRAFKYLTPLRTFMWPTNEYRGPKTTIEPVVRLMLHDITLPYPNLKTYATGAAIRLHNSSLGKAAWETGPPGLIVVKTRSDPQALQQQRARAKSSDFAQVFAAAQQRFSLARQSEDEKEDENSQGWEYSERLAKGLGLDWDWLAEPDVLLPEALVPRGEEQGDFFDDDAAEKSREAALFGEDESEPTQEKSPGAFRDAQAGGAEEKRLARLPRSADWTIDEEDEATRKALMDGCPDIQGIIVGQIQAETRATAPIRDFWKNTGARRDWAEHLTFGPQPTPQWEQLRLDHNMAVRMFRRAISKRRSEISLNSRNLRFLENPARRNQLAASLGLRKRALTKPDPEWDALDQWDQYDRIKQLLKDRVYKYRSEASWHAEQALVYREEVRRHLRAEERRIRGSMDYAVARGAKGLPTLPEWFLDWARQQTEERRERDRHEFAWLWVGPKQVHPDADAGPLVRRLEWLRQHDRSEGRTTRAKQAHAPPTMPMPELPSVGTSKASRKSELDPNNRGVPEEEDSLSAEPRPPPDAEATGRYSSAERSQKRQTKFASKLDAEDEELDDLFTGDLSRTKRVGGANLPLRSLTYTAFDPAREERRRREADDRRRRRERNSEVGASLPPGRDAPWKAMEPKESPLAKFAGDDRVSQPQERRGGDRAQFERANGPESPVSEFDQAEKPTESSDPNAARNSLMYKQLRDEKRYNGVISDRAAGASASTQLRRSAESSHSPPSPPRPTQSGGDEREDEDALNRAYEQGWREQRKRKLAEAYEQGRKDARELARRQRTGADAERRNDATEEAASSPAAPTAAAAPAAAPPAATTSRDHYYSDASPDFDDAEAGNSSWLRGFDPASPPTSTRTPRTADPRARRPIPPHLRSRSQSQSQPQPQSQSQSQPSYLDLGRRLAELRMQQEGPDATGTGTRMNRADEIGSEMRDWIAQESEEDWRRRAADAEAGPSKKRVGRKLVDALMFGRQHRT